MCRAEPAEPVRRYYTRVRSAVRCSTNISPVARSASTTAYAVSTPSARSWPRTSSPSRSAPTRPAQATLWPSRASPMATLDSAPARRVVWRQPLAQGAVGAEGHHRLAERQDVEATAHAGNRCRHSEVRAGPVPQGPEVTAGGGISHERAADPDPDRPRLQYASTSSRPTPPTARNGMSGNGSRRARRYAGPPADAGKSFTAEAPRWTAVARLGGGQRAGGDGKAPLRAGLDGGSHRWGDDELRARRDDVGHVRRRQHRAGPDQRALRRPAADLLDRREGANRREGDLDEPQALLEERHGRLDRRPPGRARG